MSKAEAVLCRSAPWRLFARRVVLPWVLSGQDLPGQVLEIGGGSGAMADTVLREHNEVDCLTVVDLDPAMVAAASRRLAHFRDRVRTDVADTTALPFPDGSFDAVLSFIMLHHVIDWQPALAEIARVLRPGGKLIGYDLTHNPVSDGFHHLDRSAVRMLSAEDLTAGLGAVGMTATTVQSGALGLVVRFQATRQ